MTPLVHTHPVGVPTQCFHTFQAQWVLISSHYFEEYVGATWERGICRETLRRLG